eukprot:1142459-Pelagomonas_calceolata.AAC.10
MVLLCTEPREEENRDLQAAAAGSVWQQGVVFLGAWDLMTKVLAAPHPRAQESMPVHPPYALKLPARKVTSAINRHWT